MEEHPTPHNLSYRSPHRSSVALAGEAARTAVACVTCRQRKIKCSGERPCRFCVKRKLRCVVRETTKRKLYSVVYVEELERKANSQSIAARGNFSPKVVEEKNDHALNADQNVFPIEADSAMSSSLNFGSRIKVMSAALDSNCSIHLSKVSKSDNAYALSIAQSPSCWDLSQAPSLPLEDEAQSLLNTVLGSVGRLQHLFDSRTFSDRLATFYDAGEQEYSSNDVWIVEMLMVFAIGRLLSGTLKENETFPGEIFFYEATARLPNICQLNATGTLGVEIMGLVAFYLQCADRKEDAYIYAGTGLRIALLMGLHREVGSTSLVRSQEAHRNRLWWTIYMQERRLAAATGNPLSIHDETIRTSYPTDIPGFCTPHALTTNIKIARTTGKILQTIYGPRERSKDEFIGEVHAILSSLQEIAATMPKDLALDFSARLNASRHSATLHLMLYQAIILATRPILLHLARGKIMRSHESSFSSQNLYQLAKPCVDASHKSLAILHALRQDGLLATFGFFDLDAIFSVAFIFVLCESIHPNPHADSTLYNIQETLVLLQYLISRGNKAASNRKLDILQMCDHLGISLDLNSHPHHGLTTDTSSTYVDEQHPYCGQTPGRYGTSATRNLAEHGGTMVNHMPLVSEMPGDSLLWADETDLAEVFTGHDPNELFALYYDDNFPLTGTVETDWEALEQQIFRSA